MSKIKLIFSLNLELEKKEDKKKFRLDLEIRCMGSNPLYNVTNLKRY